jgi:hypothetical protein
MSDISKLPRYTQRLMWVETFGESVTFGVIRGKDKLHYLWVSPHCVWSK